MAAPPPSFPTTILAVTDGSAPARRAIAVAGEIAPATKSKLHLVNVALVSRYMYPDMLNDKRVKRIKDEARSWLDKNLKYAKETKKKNQRNVQPLQPTG